LRDKEKTYLKLTKTWVEEVLFEMMSHDGFAIKNEKGDERTTTSFLVYHYLVDLSSVRRGCKL
jgi:hypothetical protein